MSRVGVVGQGFVGSVVAWAYRLAGHDVVTADVDRSKGADHSSAAELVSAARPEIVYVCVPTPMRRDGSPHLDIVDDVVSQISSAARECSYRPVVVVKSTIPPGTTRRLVEEHSGVDVCFCPEFLSVATAVGDFVRQDHIVVGALDPEVGRTVAASLVSTLAALRLPTHVPPPDDRWAEVLGDVFGCSYDPTVIVVEPEAAEVLKTAKNAFFAVKVAFANELYQVCDRIGVDYDTVRNMLYLDPRVGGEHFIVPGPTPGPDGRRRFGFGGMCLPKDLSSFITLARRLGVDPTVSSAAWVKNEEVRPDEDWKQVPGAYLDDGSQ